MSEPVELRVRTGDCPCPGKPHTEEVLYLEPELTMPMASAGMAGLRDTQTAGDVEAELTSAFLPRGIRSWSFLELGEPNPEDPEKRRSVQPVEVNRANLERLVPFDKGGYELIEKAGELYMGRFMRPLVARMSTSLQRGPTDDSTPPNPPSGSMPQKPRRPSSLNGGAGKRSVGLDL